MYIIFHPHHNPLPQGIREGKLDCPVKPGNNKKDAEMAELGDAADSKSDSTIFHNPHDYSRNRTKSSQTSICIILTVLGFSAHYLMFW
jgi:hypothetical protein